MRIFISAIWFGRAPDGKACKNVPRRQLMQTLQALQTRYAGFHQQMLTADGAAIDFYRALGFERAGKTEPMWIYAGTDH